MYSEVVSTCQNPELQKKLETLDSKEYQKVRLFVHSVQQATRDNTKPQFEPGGRVHISKYDPTFRKGCKLQFTPELIEFFAIPSKTLPTYTINMNRMRLRVKFYQKQFIEILQ